jgi:hypothetical protein
MSNDRFSRWRAELRQRRHHRPFRIAEPEWDGDHRERMRQLIAELPAVAPVADGPALNESALADAATNLWRARKRIARAAGENSRDARQVSRYLRASQEALDSAGVVVQDHDGDDYHPGLSLEVLVFQDEPELKTEKVLETVRPSVYLGDHRIQMGQVIVGCPLGPGTQTTGEDNRA